MIRILKSDHYVYLLNRYEDVPSLNDKDEYTYIDHAISVSFPKTSMSDGNAIISGEITLYNPASKTIKDMAVQASGIASFAEGNDKASFIKGNVEFKVAVVDLFYKDLKISKGAMVVVGMSPSVTQAERTITYTVFWAADLATTPFIEVVPTPEELVAGKAMLGRYLDGIASKTKRKFVFADPAEEINIRHKTAQPRLHATNTLTQILRDLSLDYRVVFALEVPKEKHISVLDSERTGTNIAPQSKPVPIDYRLGTLFNTPTIHDYLFLEVDTQLNTSYAPYDQVLVTQNEQLRGVGYSFSNTIGDDFVMFVAKVTHVVTPNDTKTTLMLSPSPTFIDGGFAVGANFQAFAISEGRRQIRSQAVTRAGGEPSIVDSSASQNLTLQRVQEELGLAEGQDTIRDAPDNIGKSLGRFGL